MRSRRCSAARSTAIADSGPWRCRRWMRAPTARGWACWRPTGTRRWRRRRRRRCNDWEAGCERGSSRCWTTARPRCAGSRCGSRPRLVTGPPNPSSRRRGSSPPPPPRPCCSPRPPPSRSPRSPRATRRCGRRSCPRWRRCWATPRRGNAAWPRSRCWRRPVRLRALSSRRRRPRTPPPSSARRRSPWGRPAARLLSWWRGPPTPPRRSGRRRRVRWLDGGWQRQ